MYVINARNVNHAYHLGLRRIMMSGEAEPSRNGPVLVSSTPVMTVYDRPTERVLFDPKRDANPFFHLFESLWMLSGAQDGRFLDRFVKDFTARYAEPGTTSLFGAYGHRWRNHFDVDQLDVVVHRLRRDHKDRRVVISMWDPVYDLIGPDDVDPDTNIATFLEDFEPRDLPCNTQIYLRISSNAYQNPPVNDQNSAEHEARIERGDDMVLDLTVMCRSNDIIWGAYGANAVHFSVLQEFLAARIGVGVGRMYQFSNNWHAYSSALDKVALNYDPDAHVVDPYLVSVGGLRARSVPMFAHPNQALADVAKFMDKPHDSIYANPWFHTTAVPMLLAHEAWRDKAPSEARRYAEQIEATDWRIAVLQWMGRRS